jgi:hypothetical protein
LAPLSLVPLSAHVSSALPSGLELLELTLVLTTAQTSVDALHRLLEPSGLALALTLVQSWAQTKALPYAPSLGRTRADWLVLSMARLVTL